MTKWEELIEKSSEECKDNKDQQIGYLAAEAVASKRQLEKVEKELEHTKKDCAITLSGLEPHIMTILEEIEDLTYYERQYFYAIRTAIAESAVAEFVDRLPEIVKVIIDRELIYQDVNAAGKRIMQE